MSRPDPIPVRNPRDGRIDASVEPPSAAELDATCARLRAAQGSWETGGLARRIEALSAFREALLSARDEIAAVLEVDTGRRAESFLEIDILTSSIARWCRLAPGLLAEPPERAAEIPFIAIRESTRGYPLVGVVAPWNFPLLLSHIDTIPALLAGCAVLVKPSEVTPRFLAPLRRVVASVPALAEVLSYAEGGGETGAAVVDRVDLVCFTGSVPTGRRVGERCAARFVPSFLELGGKDPAIVTATANLEDASSALLWGSVVGTGHSCLSIERIYVEEPVYEAFVERLVGKARSVGLSWPDASAGPIGPIIFEKQAATIREHLEDAYAKGARALCGGSVELLGGGLWCRPTVLVGVDHSMKVMTSETFGPVMPVMPVPDLDEAVRLANDTVYGLSASVFSGSEEEALALASRLEAGAVSVNDAALTALVHEAPKQAFRLSGLGGSRMGPAALRRFTRQRATLIRRSHAPDPWWFPAATS